MRTSQPAQLISPEVTRTRPLGSVVAVGYQRVKFILGKEDQVEVAGSNRWARGSPVWLVTCPPAATILPSPSGAVPEQKILAPSLVGTDVKELVAGSQSMGSFNPNPS